MELLGTAVNALVVAAVGLILAWMGKGRFDALERRVDGVEDRLAERIGRVEGQVDALRSDLTQVALAVGARPRAGNA